MPSARPPRTWTCHKVSGGEKCGHKNPRRLKKCERCGKLRSQVKQPDHLKALDESYESYVERNGGEHCGICGKPRGPDRKHHRDHRHQGDGCGRGILCFPCNHQIPDRITLRWARQLVRYLEKYEDEDGNPLY